MRDDIKMTLSPDEYPHLVSERTWPWGPITTIFEPGEPPSALVSNINIAPYDEDGWIIIRDRSGWGIVGGTLEPGETHLETLRRELFEEAGCELVEFNVFGALRMRSLAAMPYRPHLPFPISYRLLGVGRVRRVAAPTNPIGGEEILEVGAFSLDEACRRLAARPVDGPLLVEIYRLADAVRRGHVRL